MRAWVQIVIPKEFSSSRAHSLSHGALLAYGIFLLTIQLAIIVVSRNFPGILGYASNISVLEIISQTNAQRSAGNLPALKVNEKLSKAAQLKANYMFEKDFWAHIAPDGTAPWKFILDSGYKYLYAGENLAKDFQNSADVTAAWMASKAGHRENILGRNYTDIGVAVVNGTLGGFQTTLVVQMFGSTAAPLTGSEVAAAGGPRPVPQTAPAKPAPVAATPRLAEKPIVVTEAESPPQKAVLTPGVAAKPQTLSFIPASSGSFVPVVDVVALAKNISFTFGFFLLALFLLDSFVVIRRRAVRISGHNGAHVLILILLLGSTWFLSAGAIR